jgi:hypothetical protein
MAASTKDAATMLRQIWPPVPGRDDFSPVILIPLVTAVALSGISPFTIDTAAEDGLIARESDDEDAAVDYNGLLGLLRALPRWRPSKRRGRKPHRPEATP